MTSIGSAYLAAARCALTLLRDPAVAAAWDRPSALDQMTVGALAAHLGSQVSGAVSVLSGPSFDLDPATLLEHYSRATWVGVDVDAEINVAIRGKAEELGQDGPAAVVERTGAALAELESLVDTLPPGHRVRPPAGPWGLLVDDYLTTRMMEIAVHSDDLAVSVDAPTPDFPAEVLEPVLALLTALSVRRHGAPAVLRALARSERAPARINAI